MKNALKTWLPGIALTLGAFILGRSSSPSLHVSADSGDAPQVSVRPVGGDSSLIVYYPKLNKVYIYQSPFIGAPKWNCAYSIQLSTAGGTIEREQCPNPSLQF